MGRRRFESMHSGSLRVLLMCIKTLANYVVFTPSGVLVSIDYGPVCGTVRVNDESRPIRSLDT